MSDGIRFHGLGDKRCSYETARKLLEEMELPDWAEELRVSTDRMLQKARAEEKAREEKKAQEEEKAREEEKTREEEKNREEEKKETEGP